MATASMTTKRQVGVGLGIMIIHKRVVKDKMATPKDSTKKHSSHNEQNMIQSQEYIGHKHENKFSGKNAPSVQSYMNRNFISWQGIFYCVL